MFGLLKKSKAPDSVGTPLTLASVEGDELLVFPSQIVASVRHMITGLACGEGIPTKLAVTSALREEGVTHTALTMATVLANDTASRVCVVELNWWSPGLIALLTSHGTPNTKGAPTERGLPPSLGKRPQLAELLAGSATLKDALIPTALPNLNLLAAGDLPLEQRPSAARGAALKAIIDDLATQYDHLILDIPAVLATSDAMALAAHGDASVVVVRHGLTPTQTVQLALDDMKHLKVLGVILTKARSHTPRFILDMMPGE